MAIFTNTFTTFDSTGNREHLTDAIYNVDPDDTPFLSMARKPQAEATLYEWQTDSLASAVTTNQVVQGNDITSPDAVSATTRLGNYTSIAEKTFVISRTQQRVRSAGRPSEINYQSMKNGKELKRDMESHLLANVGGTAGNSSTAPVAAGLGAWIKSNDSLGATGGSPTYTSGVPSAARTDGTQRTFTETIHKAVIKLVYDSGGEASILMLGSFNKQTASSFSGVVTHNFNQTGNQATTIIAAADVYRSDFGLMQIIPNRFQRPRDGWYVDPEFYSVPHLDPIRREELAKTGDARKFLLNVEYTLEVKNEAAHGLAADLTTS